MDEYLTSNTQTAYPFVENSSLHATGTYGMDALFPISGIVDAIITAWSDNVYLTSITPVGGVYRFVFSDDAGAVLTYYYTNDSFTDYYHTVCMSNTDIVVKFVVTQSFYDYLANLTISTAYNALRFESRVVNRMGTQLREFVIDSTSINNGVRLVNGYNNELIVLNNTITLNASPGAGQGLNPCDEVPSTRNPLDIIPDSDGNIEIEGDACHTIIPHVSMGIIEIQGNCKSCCTCEDYVRVGRAVNRAWQREEALRLTKLGGVHTAYNAGVAGYNDKYFKELRPLVRMVTNLGRPEGGVGFRGTFHVHIFNPYSELSFSMQRLEFVSFTGGISYGGIILTSRGDIPWRFGYHTGSKWFPTEYELNNPPYLNSLTLQPYAATTTHHYTIDFDYRTGAYSQAGVSPYWAIIDTDGSFPTDVYVTLYSTLIPESGFDFDTYGMPSSAFSRVSEARVSFE